MKNKTQAAQAAAQIKAILKKEFPTVKFSVKSSNYSMGNSVSVNWTNGASEKKVKKLICHYQYGSFDSMQDLYESNNRIDGLPQTKWLSLNRKISDEIYLQKFEELKQKWDILKDIESDKINKTNQELFNYCECWTAKQFIYQEFDGFRDIDFLEESKLKITIQEEINEKKRLNKLFDAGKLGCKLVDYSDKAVALFGNTKPLKEKLKELGGRFNPFLNNNGEKMAGWIFPKTKINELEALFN